MSTQTLTARRDSGAIWSMLLLGGALFLGWQIVKGGPMIRVVAAIVVILILAVPALEHPRKAVTGLFIVLPFLGMLRHMFLSSTGPAFLDPLLLITSAVSITVLISLILNKEMDFGGTPLSKVVFLLLAVGVLQIFNPEQGEGMSGLLVGLTGVMINLIPISFFFIARSISDLAMTHRIVRIVIAIGVLSGLYGISQVFFGFRGFERQFIESGFTALTVGGTTRPFSTFNNPAEFASYLHLAFTAAFAMLLFTPRGKRIWWLVAAVVITYAGFLTGSRGFTVKVGLAVIVLLAARAKNRAMAFGVIVILVTGVVWWSSSTTSDSTIQEKEAGASQLVEQQLRALRDPFDPAKSTVPVHFNQFKDGMVYAITERPFGQGTGVATRGGAKFEGTQASTELDIGDMFLSLGVIGGVLYLSAIGLTVVQAARVRRALPGPVWIAIWAMAVTSIGAWVIGGNYAVVPLIWFLIGASDGAYKRLRSRGLLEHGGALPS
ncbi:MAG TPA: hypothetical protein VGB52_12615 [Actinomycetota bacterium]